MHKKEKLEYLFARYFSQCATPEEEAELAKFVSEADKETLSHILENAWEDVQPSEPVISPQRAEIILEQIMEGKDEPVQETMAKPAKKTAWLKYAAAALVFLAIATTSIYFLNRTGKPKAPFVKKVLNDLEPGQAGAILALANGEKILLDSAGNGLLAMQGGTQVINNKGELSYKSRQATDGPVMYNTMITPKGRQYQLQLSDGSKVWLNAASSISYPTVFAANERKVTVTGEAYFKISPDKTKPFKVNIDGKGELEVLGTEFNVNAYADEPTVNATLLEGSVKIKSTLKNHHTDSRSGQSAMLRPGQQAQLGAELHVVNEINTDEVTAWKNGYFSFSGATTEAIMRQVKRWYDAEVLYEGTVKEERFVGSVPRSANASKLLEVLELTKTVKFTIEDKKIVVKPY